MIRFPLRLLLRRPLYIMRIGIAKITAIGVLRFPLLVPNAKMHRLATQLQSHHFLHSKSVLVPRNSGKLGIWLQNCPATYSSFSHLKCIFHQRKRFLYGSFVIPQNHMKTGIQETIVYLLGINTSQTISKVFHCCIRIFFMQ